MSGNLWMFSDMLDDEDIEMQKHDFITLYQGADYYGLGLKSFTRMTRVAGAVYKIGKKVLMCLSLPDTVRTESVCGFILQVVKVSYSIHRVMKQVFPCADRKRLTLKIRR